MFLIAKFLHQFCRYFISQSITDDDHSFHSCILNIIAIEILLVSDAILIIEPAACFIEALDPLNIELVHSLCIISIKSLFEFHDAFIHRQCRINLVEVFNGFPVILVNQIKIRFISKDIFGNALEFVCSESFNLLVCHTNIHQVIDDGLHRRIERHLEADIS